MGLNFMVRNCCIDPRRDEGEDGDPIVLRPMPDPLRFEIVDVAHYDNAHVLHVYYPGCTNYEGVKILVLPGKYELRTSLDPHFSKEEGSPIARFKPDETGWALACAVAEAL